MLSKREFYSRVRTEIENARTELNKLKKQLQDVETDMRPENRMYSREYRDSVLRPKRDDLKRQIAAKETAANKKIKEMCNNYTDDLRSQDDLKPEELTDDVKLLNSGIKLNSKDIKAMLNRNRSNRTMCQVILRYAEEHNIETDGTMYVGNSALIGNVQALPTIAETCIRWSNSDRVWNELIENNTSLSSVFAD